MNTKQISLQSQIQHELMTPISCILGCVDCLQMMVVDEEQKCLLDAIAANTQSLMALKANISALMNKE